MPSIELKFLGHLAPPQDPPLRNSIQLAVAMQCETALIHEWYPKHKHIPQAGTWGSCVLGAETGYDIAVKYPPATSRSWRLTLRRHRMELVCQKAVLAAPTVRTQSDHSQITFRSQSDHIQITVFTALPAFPGFKN